MSRKEPTKQDILISAAITEDLIRKRHRPDMEAAVALTIAAVPITCLSFYVLLSRPEQAYVPVISACLLVIGTITILKGIREMRADLTKLDSDVEEHLQHPRYQEDTSEKTDSED